MSQEYAGCAGHCQQIGIGCQRVLSNGVLLIICSAIFRVVILNESHSILTIVTIFITFAYKWPVIVILLGKKTPVFIVDGIAYSIAELEVEGGTGFFCTVNPFGFSQLVKKTLDKSRTTDKIEVTYLLNG